MARTYARLFTDSRRCEAPGCRVEPFFLWQGKDGSLYRSCTPAHAQAAEEQQRRPDHRASVQSARP